MTHILTSFRALFLSSVNPTLFPDPPAACNPCAFLRAKRRYMHALLLVITLTATACRPQKNITNSHAADTTVTAFYHDTASLFYRDTAAVSLRIRQLTHDTITLTFLPDGGSYNPLTGQAGNLAKATHIRHQLRQQNTDSTAATRISALQRTCDSLRLQLRTQTVMHEQHTATGDITPQPSPWHRFLLAWFIATAAFLLAYILILAFRFYRRLHGM